MRISGMARITGYVGEHEERLPITGEALLADLSLKAGLVNEGLPPRRIRLYRGDGEKETRRSLTARQALLKAMGHSVVDDVANSEADQLKQLKGLAGILDVVVESVALDKAAEGSEETILQVTFNQNPHARLVVAPIGEGFRQNGMPDRDIPEGFTPGHNYDQLMAGVPDTRLYEGRDLPNYDTADLVFARTMMGALGGFAWETVGQTTGPERYHSSGSLRKVVGHLPPPGEGEESFRGW